jgi:hypothetical protein
VTSLARHINLALLDHRCQHTSVSANSRFANTWDSSFRYENCAAGNGVTGKGTVVVVNETLVLTSQGVSATVNLGSNSGSASVQEFNGGPSVISDSNTADSVCLCTGS